MIPQPQHKSDVYSECHARAAAAMRNFKSQACMHKGVCPYLADTQFSDNGRFQLLDVERTKGPLCIVFQHETQQVALV